MIDKYVKTEWIPNVTLVSADNLNKLENKVEELTNANKEKITNTDILYEEVQTAKIDFNGVQRTSLSERIVKDIGYINDRFNNANSFEYEGIDISANKSFDGVARDIKIKGRTLRNLIEAKYMYFNKSAIVTNINLLNNIKFDVEFLDEKVGNNPENRAMIESNFRKYLKPNTKYTFMFKAELLANPFNEACSIGLAIDNLAAMRPSSAVYNVGDQFYFCFVKQTPSEISSICKEFIFVNYAGRNSKWRVRDVVMLEGDYSSEDITFFDKTKSVGEEGSIDIVSCGKNLFNMNTIVETDSAKLEGNAFRFKCTPTETYTSILFYNKLKPGTYSINIFDNGVNCNNNAKMWAYNKNKKLISNSQNNAIFNLKEEADTIRIVMQKLVIGEEVNRLITVQIEKVNFTSYEPYKESRITAKLNEPLRSLLNGTYDEIDVEDNKLIKRIDKVTLDGSPNELWIRYDDGNEDGVNTMIFSAYLSRLSNRKPSDENGYYSLEFKNHDTVSIKETEGIHLRPEEDFRNYVYVRINKDKLSSQSAAGFKEWIKANPITIFYELKNPIESSIEISKDLRTFDEYTYISSEGSFIDPIISCKVPSDVNYVVSKLIQEKDNLSNNINTLSESNKELKANNEVIEAALNNNLIATFEMCKTMDGLLNNQIDLLDETKEDDIFKKFYSIMVERGLKEVNDIPESYR